MGKFKELCKKLKFYAVRRGRRPGIYNTWEECKKQTDGFKHNEYQLFRTLDDAIRFMYYGHPPKDLKGPLDKYFKQNK